MTGIDLATHAREPFFSVVIPVYDRADKMAKAINSVLDQTFQDFEIIIVDDGSTDDVLGALPMYADSRIRCTRQTNQGSSGARNTGIAMSRGRFIAFLDSDDAFLPHHLAAAATIVSVEDVVVYSSLIMNRGKAGSFVKPPRAIAPGEHMATYLFCDRGFVGASGLILPARLARKVTFNTRLSYGDDFDYAIRLYLKGLSFTMMAEPSLVVDDTDASGRISVTRDLSYSCQWLEDVRSSIPPRAYFGFRGWHLARFVAQRNYLKGMGMYLVALVRGCYTPRVALAVLLQVALPRRIYRTLSDLILRRASVLRLAGFQRESQQTRLTADLK